MRRFRTQSPTASGQLKNDSFWLLARLKYFAVSVCWFFLIAYDIGFASALTGQENAQNANMQVLEGQKFLQQHQYAEAEQSFKSALKNTSVSDSKSIIDLLNYIGATLHAQKKEKEASDFFSRALAALPEKTDAGDVRKAKILSNLSLVHSSQGNSGKAIECCEEALSVFRAKNATPLDFAVLLNSLGRMKLDAGDAERARSLFTESISVREKIKGIKSVELVSPLINLSGAFLAQRKVDQAEEACRRASAICQQKDGEDSRKLFPLLSNLAAVQVEQHRYTEAISTFNRAREVAEKCFGRNSKETLTAYFALSEFYERDGQIELSEQSLTRAIEICRFLYGHADKKTLEATLALSHLFELHGNSAEAERLRLLCRLTQSK